VIIQLVLLIGNKLQHFRLNIEVGCNRKRLECGESIVIVVLVPHGFHGFIGIWCIKLNKGLMDDGLLDTDSI
jgi:hypothetical protein